MLNILLDPRLPRKESFSLSSQHPFIKRCKNFLADSRLGTHCRITEEGTQRVFVSEVLGNSQNERMTS